MPIEIRVRTVVEVPAEWDDHQVEFWLNESSHCLHNELRLLVERDPEGYCSLCTQEGTQAIVLKPEEHADLMEKYRERPLGSPPVEDEG